MLKYSDISVERNFRLIDESVEIFANECDNMISSFDDRCNKALNSSFKFEAVEELDFYEEGVVDVIEGIGKKVIELFNKLIEAAKDLVTNIQTKLFAKKNNLEKVEAVLKKHPEFSKEISVALEKDGLGVTDWKNIKDAEESISKILEDYAKGKIGKEDAEKKKDEQLKRLKTKMDVISSGKYMIAGAIGIVGAIAFFKSDFFKSISNMENHIRSSKDSYEKDHLAIAKMIKENLGNKYVVRHGYRAAKDADGHPVKDPKTGKPMGEQYKYIEKQYPKLSTQGVGKDKKIVDSQTISNDEKLDISHRFSDFERMNFSFHSQLIQIENENLKNIAKFVRICSGIVTAFSRRHDIYSDDVDTIMKNAGKSVKFNEQLNSFKGNKKD